MRRTIRTVLGCLVAISLATTSSVAVAAIPGMTIPGMGGESAVNETEADEMEEHLRGLGYIE